MDDVSKYNQEECILDQNSPDLQAHTAFRSDCIIIKIPPAEVVAQWDVNDDDRELKCILRDLRWTGMITDALIVLAITGAIYISPTLDTLRAVVERTAISVAEASRTH